jgi:hypothetical protein
MLRFLRGLALCGALTASSCGRTGLVDSTPPDAGPVVPPAAVRSCAPVELHLPCAAAIATADAGSEVWSAGLDVGARDLIGPAAVDDLGGSYFLAADSGLYVKTVFALDACGGLRWQAAVESLLGSGYLPQVMVAGNTLLLVGVGSIVALDLTSGAHAWTADLTAFAQGGGLGVAPGKVQALGYTAARADGSAITVVANDHDEWLVAVSPTGAMHPVARVANVISGTSYTLGMQQVIIDAAGNVLLAVGVSAAQTDLLHSFTAAGAANFEVSLPSWGVGSVLAAGPDFVTGRGEWVLGADGVLRNANPGGGPALVEWGGPTVIDGEGHLVVVGTEYPPGASTPRAQLLGSFTSDGALRWRVTLDEPVTAGPLLGDGDRLFVLTSASGQPGSARHLEARAQSTGAEAWRVPLSDSGPRPTYWALLTNAGVLLVTDGSRVRAYASGSVRPPTCAWWPTPRGGADQRACAYGR